MFPLLSLLPWFRLQPLFQRNPSWVVSRHSLDTLNLGHEASPYQTGLDWIQATLPTTQTYPKAASAYNRRQEGLYKDKDNTMKFAVGKDLDSFYKRLLAIFTDYGMDTICYRKDPDKDPPEMINILKYYPRLNYVASDIS
jgi:hypothetical protein